MADHELYVCVNFRPFSGQPSCAYRGSKELADWLEQEIRERGLDIAVEHNVCMGYCLYGPNIKIKGGRMVHEATKEKLLDVLDELADTAG